MSDAYKGALIIHPAADDLPALAAELGQSFGLDAEVMDDRWVILWTGYADPQAIQDDPLPERLKRLPEVWYVEMVAYSEDRQEAWTGVHVDSRPQGRLSYEQWSQSRDQSFDDWLRDFRMWEEQPARVMFGHDDQ